MQIDSLSLTQVLSNSFWKFLESAGVQLLQLLVTIVLARLLSPEDYGLMALVLVVITFLGFFVSSGIGSYLIYINNIRKQDFFTALVFNIVLSIILVLILLFYAGDIAVYYSSPVLKNLIIAMAFILPFNAISSIYNAYAMKMSLFKVLFIRNIIALPVSGIVALILAFSGFGVWALVIYQIVYRILLSAIIVGTVKVEVDGNWEIDMRIFKPMIKFGGFTFLSTVIAFISDSVSDLLIGKKFSKDQLGLYNRGGTFPGVFISVVNSVLSESLLVAFASYNTDLVELKSKFSKTIKILYYAISPLLFGLFACAKPLVVILLTEKWIDIVPVIQLYCLFYLPIPFLQTSSQIFLATGHVKLRTLGEIVKMVVTLISLYLAIDYGILAVVLGRTMVNLFLLLYTMLYNRFIMHYGFRQAIKDIFKPLIVGLLVFAGAYLVLYIPADNIILLILQVIVGFVMYGICYKLFKIKEIEELTSMLYSKVKKK